MSKKRIAIVGGGVAGVSAFWSLNKYSSHEVHLFEASERLGGRIQTLPVEHRGLEAIVGTGLTPFSKDASRMCHCDDVLLSCRELMVVSKLLRITQPP
jgi:predicted NAD/FAD-binding protein